MIIGKGFYPVSKSFSDRTMQLAYDELVKLMALRFENSQCINKLELELKIEGKLPGFQVECNPGKLTIAGPEALDILYGVYDFAEAYLGYCFLEPGHDRLCDSSAMLELKNGILTPARKPLLKRRGLVQEFPFGEVSFLIADWMAKNKLNFLQTWLEDYDLMNNEMKEYYAVRGIEIASGQHSFNYLIPAQKYYHNHPEFFAERNGRRNIPTKDRNEFLLSEQLCTTNPELRKEITKNIAEYCRKHPELKSVPLTPNDGFGWCECEKCLEFYDKDKKGDLYSVSEHVYEANRIYHDMLADVGAQLRKDYPDVKAKLFFYAYVNYSKPASGFKLNGNYDFGFAPYWRCINHAIFDPACYTNASYAGDLKKWLATRDGGDVNIYEYYMGVNFYISLPMIHHENIFDEVKWYNEIGVTGVYTQFHVPHWTVYGLNFYQMAKAAYGGDKKQSVTTMMRKLFGKDVAEAEIFYDELKKLVLSVGKCHIPYPYSLLSRTTLKQYQAIFKLAVMLRDKAPEDRFRRELVLWSEYMVRFKTLFDKYRSEGVGVDEVKAFQSWCAQLGDTRILVQNMVKMYLDAWIKALEDGKQWLHFNIDWEDAYIRKHRQTLK